MTGTARVFFHEDQHFRGSLIWSLLGLVAAAALALAALNAGRERPATTVLTLAVLAGVGALLAFARLETEVRADGVTVTFHGLWPTRRIRLADITEATAVRYTIWDSGGWGVHLGLAGMTYNVSGNEGVRLRLANGSGVLIGSQRSAELAAAIAAARAARG